MLFLLSATLLAIGTQAHAQAPNLRQTMPTVLHTARTQAVENGDRLTLARDAVIKAFADLDDCLDLADCQAKLTTANRRVEQLSEELSLADQTTKSAQAETLKVREALAKADERILGLLDVIKEYATVPKSQQKSFWQKVKKKLVDLIDVATDAKTIQSIASIILLIKATKE